MIETVREGQAPKGELPLWMRDYKENDPYWMVKFDYKKKEENKRTVSNSEEGYGVESKC